MNQSEYSDRQVMQKVREGNVEMLAILFERHHKKLYGFLFRLTSNTGSSQDLVQEVFLRILKYRHTFQGRSTFPVWMYRIARNVFNDYLKKYKNDMPLENQKEMEDPAPQPGEVIAREQEVSMLQQALLQLPMKKRQILMLSRFQNLKYKEIARLFECSIESIKVQVHRALKDLRIIYNQLKGGVT